MTREILDRLVLDLRELLGPLVQKGPRATREIRDRLVLDLRVLPVL